MKPVVRPHAPGDPIDAVFDEVRSDPALRVGFAVAYGVNDTDQTVTDVEVSLLSERPAGNWTLLGQRTTPVLEPGQQTEPVMSGQRNANIMNMRVQVKYTDADGQRIEVRGVGQLGD